MTTDHRQMNCRTWRWMCFLMYSTSHVRRVGIDSIGLLFKNIVSSDTQRHDSVFRIHRVDRSVAQHRSGFEGPTHRFCSIWRPG
jgi:hypothetical protein